MAQDTKAPKDEGRAHERAQRDLTASVGTRLELQEKGRKKRRLFGRRRKPSTPGS
jgi:hypothetical protein